MSFSPEALAAISLIALVLTIAIAFWRKMNPGIVAFGTTLIVGIIAGIPTKDLIAGFNSNLFVILLGAGFFATISQINGTLELLAKKVVNLVGSQAKLVPFAMFFVGILLAGSGPGTVPGIALCAIFAAPLSKTLKCDPLIIGYAGQLGAIVGGIAPWCATGIISSNLSQQAGFGTLELSTFMCYFVGHFIICVLMFFLMKGWRIKSDHIDRSQKLPAFNMNQRLTLLATVIMISIVIIFKTNIGLTCFVVGSVLCAFRIVKMEDCIKKITWGVILMVVGVGMLMHVVIIAGGIKLLTTLIASIANGTTLAPIISLIAGCATLFSSASGVVLPALIPTCPDLIQALNMTDPLAPAILVGSIGVGSHLAGLSPASTGGALQLGAINNEFGTEVDSNKLFVKMFALAASSFVISSLFPLFVYPFICRFCV